MSQAPCPCFKVPGVLRNGLRQTPVRYTTRGKATHYVRRLEHQVDDDSFSRSVDRHPGRSGLRTARGPHRGVTDRKDLSRWACCGTPISPRTLATTSGASLRTATSRRPSPRSSPTCRRPPHTGDISRWRGGIGASITGRDRCWRPSSRSGPSTSASAIMTTAPIRAGLCDSDDSGETVKADGFVTAMAGPVRMIVLDWLLSTDVYGGMIGKAAATCSPPISTSRRHAHGPSSAPTPRADLLDTRRQLDIVTPIQEGQGRRVRAPPPVEARESDGVRSSICRRSGPDFTRAQPGRLGRPG